MSTRPSMTLTTRIVVVLVLLAAVVLAGVSVLSYRSGRAALETAVISELLSASVTKASEIDAWFGTRVADVETVARSPVILDAVGPLLAAAPASAQAREAHDRIARELLPHTQATPRANAMIAVVDAVSGRILVATDPAIEGRSLADEPFFQPGHSGTHVHAPHLSDEIAGPAIAIATPLRGWDGKVRAILVGWPDIAQMNEIILRRSGLHETDDAYLVNPEQLFVTQPRFRTVAAVLREKVDTDAVRLALAGKTGVLFNTDYRDVPAITVYRWLPKQKLGLIAKIDEQEAMAPVRRFGQAVLLYAVLVMLGTIAAAVLLARTITRPVQQLQQGVARFGRGELDVRLPVESDDELGLLAEEFNGMAASIAEKDALLRANTADLERRVQERTRALQQQADLLELAHDAIIVRELDGTIRFWNRGAEEIYGFRRSEVVGIATHSLLQTRFPESREAVEGALAGSGRWEGEVRHTRRDGTQITVASRHALQRDEHGRPAAVLEINSDISERIRAEEDRNRFFRLSLDMLATANFEGYFTQVNPAWVATTGYSEEELCSRPFLDFVHPDDHAATIAAADDLAAGKEVIAFENRYVCKDGAIKWLAWLAAPVSEHGLIYAAARDITERKRAEEELQKAKEAAEAAARAKSEFLANMSHEIRTPMNGVIGLTDLVLRTPLSPQQHEYLTLIKSSADSLLRLLNDILDFSKMEAGKLALETIDFDIRESLGNTLKAFAASANEKGLELAYHVVPGIPKLLAGDPGRLAQIVVNLVGNALKFTHHGEVVLRVSLDAQEDDRALLHFTVSDTGIGIPAELQAHIFSAFSQADSSTTRQYGGTGLGLAIVSQLVEMMGGRIWLDSQPGRGTTFHFTARMKVPEQPADTDLHPEPVMLAGMRVLVADDNRTNRTILDEILRSWGVEPTLAESGGQALSLLQAGVAEGRPYALVLLDAQMPRFDGFRVVEAIKANPAYGSATIMMLSSNDLSGEVERCKILGVSRYLRKPVKQSELFDAMVSALGMMAAQQARPASDAQRVPKRLQRRLRVLVAEDHPINQRLVIETLAERGHSFAIANNGREVLAMVERQQFDVILMDGQMPEMDGYQATAEIRRRERETGGHVRIIAVTANAMKEDRDVCLAAGMDDYVSKPVDPVALIECIEAAGPAPGPAADARPLPSAVAPPQAVGGFDASEALRRARNKPALLRQLLGVFLRELPASLAELDDAVARGDAGHVERVAHRLRGSATTLSADPLAHATGKLEQCARRGELAAMPDLMEQLRERAADAVAGMNAAMESLE